MAGKAPPTGRQKKARESRPKTGASQLRKGEKVTARMKKRGGEPEADIRPETDIGPKGDGGVVIKEEIPEALAYFLEVYGRLGRG